MALDAGERRHTVPAATASGARASNAAMQDSAVVSAMDGAIIMAPVALSRTPRPPPLLTALSEISSMPAVSSAATSFISESTLRG